MKILPNLKTNSKLFFYTFSFFLVSFIFGIEVQNPSSSPKFSIYSDKTPVFATLSGNFTFYPEREIQKAESLLNSKKQPQKHASSSYLSIKYGNKVYKFYELKAIKSEWDLEDNSIHITGFIPDVDVEVFMTLKNNTQRNESFFITYGVINNTSRIIDIGFRSLIDVGAEDNENIPLKICTDSTNEKEIFLHEYKFTPYKSAYWETYESNQDSTIGFRHFLTGNKNTPPDQIAFVNWEKAYLSDWKYFTNKNISTESDSAVLVWWNSRPVKPGETLEIQTEFEIKKQKELVSFQLLDSTSGYGRLHLKTTNTTNFPKEVSFFIDAGEYTFTAPTKENPIKYFLEPNEVLDKIFPLTIHGKGEVPLTIKEKIGTLETNHSLLVKLSQENKNQSPKFWKTSKYPIIYNSDKDGLKLKGIVRAKDSGKKLGETELISVRSIQKSYVYLGEVDIREFNGEVFVEIFQY